MSNPIAMGQWSTSAWDWVACGWWAGWLAGGIAVGCAFAHDVGKAGGSRVHALVGGTIRGSLVGMVWPLALLWWALARWLR